jgi:predicted amidohydrolase
VTALRLGLLQYGVERLRRFEAFAAKIDRLVAAGAAGADLLVFPEYACMEVAAALGAPPDPRAERDAVCARAAELLALMSDAARRHGVWLLAGSLPWREGTRIRNRAPLIAPDGRLAFQDKHVMTRFESESWGIDPGDPPAVFATPWGILGVAICYDLEFPSLVRAQVTAGAWLVLAPSCTDTRHGFNRVRLSARARALENQCFVAVAPTVGLAPHLAALDSNHGFAGVYGPVDLGFPDDGVLVEGGLDVPGFVFVTLDPARLDAVRADGAVRNYLDWPVDPPACRVVELVERPGLCPGLARGRWAP